MRSDISILIVINSKKYKYHKDFVKVMSTLTETVSVVDMSSDKLLHELFYEIDGSSSKMIMTLDFAGFELRTEMDNISLNSISKRIVNVLFHKKNHYTDELKYRQNLSMFTYFCRKDMEDDNSLLLLKEKYPLVPNINFFCEYDCLACSEIEVEKNKRNVVDWFEYIIKDIRI